jgi:hypothetical protein
MKATEQPTIALIVSSTNQEKPVLCEALTSADEILELELALMNSESDPLKRVRDYRSKQNLDEEEFADFVEGLLSQPFVKPDVQEHAVQWFKSRAKIEAYQKAEDTASQVIAMYAFEIYQKNPNKTDFFLAGPKAKVRIRVIEVRDQQKEQAA